MDKYIHIYIYTQYALVLLKTGVELPNTSHILAWMDRFYIVFSQKSTYSIHQLCFKAEAFNWNAGKKRFRGGSILTAEMLVKKNQGGSILIAEILVKGQFQGGSILTAEMQVKSKFNGEAF